MEIPKLTLISGEDVLVPNLCHLRQPTLRDIRDVGYLNYSMMLTYVFFSKNNIAEFCGVDDAALLDEINVFELLISSEYSVAELEKALSFFIVEPICFDPKHQGFAVIGEDGNPIGFICKDNIELVKNCLAQICHLSGDVIEKEPEHETRKAKEIRQKLQKGRDKMRKAKAAVSPDTSLENLIPAVAYRSNGYNLLNIWDLTLYQFYDQFERINQSFYLDMMATRWCAWGEGEFKAPPWFAGMESTNE